MRTGTDVRRFETERPLDRRPARQSYLVGAGQLHERKGLADDYFADRHFPTLREVVRINRELLEKAEGKEYLHG